MLSEEQELQRHTAGNYRSLTVWIIQLGYCQRNRNYRDTQLGTIGVRQLGLYSLDIVRGTGTAETHRWEL